MLTENGPDSIQNDATVEAKVCRDFLRNVCRRGKKRCKFLHPEDTPAEGEATGRFVYIFCHDFQNTQGCQREGCKFLHCSSAEEEYYKATGKLPGHVLGHALSKGQAVDVVPGRPGEAPVCKDYLKGECRRAGHCKFRHLTTRQYELEMGYAAPSPPPPPPPPPPAPAPMVRYSTTALPDPNGPPEAKRFHYSTGAGSPPDARHVNYVRPAAPAHAPQVNCEAAPPPPPPMMVLPHHTTFALPPPVSAVSALTTVTATSPPHRLLTPAEARTLMLEEENNVLRRRLEELKKQVSDLTVTNEFLLDQNAQLRMGSKRTTTNLSTLTVPAVTITNGGQPLSAQITSAQTPTPQQMVNAAAAVAAAGTLRTVTASVAAVPVSIAAVAGTPVSIATVSMAPVTLPPPVVTMAQTIGVSGQQQTVCVSGPQQAITVSGPQQALGVSGPQQTLGVSGPQQTIGVGVAGPQQTMGVSGPQQTMGVSGPQATIGVSGPQPPQPPPQQQTAPPTCPQSLPLTISAATAPLVSYPIPVLQTSLSH